MSRLRLLLLFYFSVTSFSFAFTAPTHSSDQVVDANHTHPHLSDNSSSSSSTDTSGGSEAGKIWLICLLIIAVLLVLCCLCSCCFPSPSGNTGSSILPKRGPGASSSTASGRAKKQHPPPTHWNMTSMTGGGPTHRIQPLGPYGQYRGPPLGPPPSPAHPELKGASTTQSLPQLKTTQGGKGENPRSVSTFVTAEAGESPSTSIRLANVPPSGAAYGTPYGTALSMAADPKLAAEIEAAKEKKSKSKNSKSKKSRTNRKEQQGMPRASSDASFQVVSNESIASTGTEGQPPPPISPRSKRKLGVGTRSYIFSGRPAKQLSRRIQSVSSQQRSRSRDRSRDGRPPNSAQPTSARLGGGRGAVAQQASSGNLQKQQRGRKEKQLPKQKQKQKQPPALSPASPAFECKSPSSITSYQTVMYTNELNIRSLLDLARKHHEARLKRHMESPSPSPMAKSLKQRPQY